MIAAPFGWGCSDLTPEAVRAALAAGHDPDAAPFPAEATLAGHGNIARARMCHRVLHAWRLNQGRTLEAMAGRLALAVRFLVFNQVAQAQQLIKDLDPSQWPSDRPGIIPQWLNAYVPSVQPAIVKKLYASPFWQPWLNRTGPRGWKEGWDLFPCAGRATLNTPDTTVVAPVLSRPKPADRKLASGLWASAQAWPWLSQQTEFASVPHAVADHARRWAVHGQKETFTPVTAVTALCGWIGLGLIHDPDNAVETSAAVVHQLWGQTPEAIPAIHQILKTSDLPDFVHRALLRVLPLGQSHPGSAPVLPDEAVWPLLPAPDPTWRPELEIAVTNRWLQLLATHPAWVTERPLLPQVADRLAHADDVRLTAAWRQAWAHASSTVPETPRRRWRT
jgi:hypothetical protein